MAEWRQRHPVSCVCQSCLPRDEHDPGPLPEEDFEPTARTKDPEPYIELLEWIFNGPPSMRKGDYPRAMSPAQRARWLETHCPRTFELVLQGRAWPGLGA